MGKKNILVYILGQFVPQKTKLEFGYRSSFVISTLKKFKFSPINLKLNHIIALER